MGLRRNALLLVLLLVFAASIRHALWAASCRIGMAEQPIPETTRWRTWPVLPGLAGYMVVDLAPYRDLGWTSPRPHPPGDARLAGLGVCAERGASVQSWLGQDFVAMSGDDWTLRLREEPATHTVLATGERTRPGEERIDPRPLAAFRREADGPALLLARVFAWPAASLMALVAWWRARRRRLLSRLAAEPFGDDGSHHR
jgi:hypothetical protein